MLDNKVASQMHARAHPPSLQKCYARPNLFVQSHSVPLPYKNATIKAPSPRSPADATCTLLAAEAAELEDAAADDEPVAAPVPLEVPDAADSDPVADALPDAMVDKLPVDPPALPPTTVVPFAAG